MTLKRSKCKVQFYKLNFFKEFRSRRYPVIEEIINFEIQEEGWVAAHLAFSYTAQHRSMYISKSGDYLPEHGYCFLPIMKKIILVLLNWLRLVNWFGQQINKLFVTNTKGQAV